MDLPDKTAQPAKPKKDIKPVVTGAKQVSRPASKRFFDFLFAESPKDVSKKIGREIIVPRIKAGVEEAFNSFLSGMLWGGSQNRPMSNLVQQAMLRGGGVQYSQISTGNALNQARQASPTTSSSYQDVVLPSQQLAESLLASMIELHNQYRVVSVADLYELAGFATSPFHEGIGWHGLEQARIVKSREGYVLELPRPTMI